MCKKVYEVTTEEIVKKSFYVKADSMLDAKESAYRILQSNPEAGIIVYNELSSLDDWEVCNITDQKVPDKMIDTLG